MKDGIELTSERARQFGVAEKRDNESEIEFKYRVSGELRAQGHVIEAHEAFNNSLYDDETDSDAMFGILGAAALALNHSDFQVDGIHQVGDDIAAGYRTQQPKDNSAGLLALMAIMLGK